jgi:hypothetical protein
MAARYGRRRAADSPLSLFSELWPVISDEALLVTQVKSHFRRMQPATALFKMMDSLSDQ